MRKIILLGALLVLMVATPWVVMADSTTRCYRTADGRIVCNTYDW